MTACRRLPGGADTPCNQWTIMQPLTSAEFGSLLELAAGEPPPAIPAADVTRLIEAGYVVRTPQGLVVTGDGLLRITESE